MNNNKINHAQSKVVFIKEIFLVVNIRHKRQYRFVEWYGLWLKYYDSRNTRTVSGKCSEKKVSLLKTRHWQRCFPVKFWEIFKNTFFAEHLQTTTSILRDKTIDYIVPWNYNTNWNIIQINSFIKVYWIWHVFEVECESL